MRIVTKILLLCCVTCTLCAQETSITISNTVEHIAKRFYFIERLKKTIGFIQKLDAVKNPPLLEFVTYLDNANLFVHRTIAHIIHEMRSHKRLFPILNTWQDFVRYQDLDDELFLDEFTKLLLVISKKFLLYLLPRHPAQFALISTVQQLYEHGLSVPSDCRLEYIDTLIQEAYNLNKTKKRICHDVQAHSIKNFTESVSYRYYYIKRLSALINYLISQKNISFAKMTLESNTVNFTHERIQEALETLAKDLNPARTLDQLWYEFSHYKYLEDTEFLKEFAELIFLFGYHNIMESGSKNRMSIETINHLITLYERLQNLPLEDILNAIDMLARELPTVSQKYELDSNMSWQEWFRKYWWAPPLVISTIAVKILLVMKAHQMARKMYTGRQ